MNKKHDYHFVLNSNMKNDLKCFAEKNNFKLSEAVNFIFKLYKKKVLNFQYLENEEDNSYEIINADCDIHVYISKKDYRFIKQIKSSMNIFSMAIILRNIIKLFFLNLQEFSLQELLNFLNKEKIHTNNIYCRLKNWKKNVLNRQLSVINTFRVDYSLKFNKNHQLVGIKLNR